MSYEDSFGQRVLRVDQLDVVDYDQYILSIIRGEISKCFKYFQPGLLTKIDPELRAVLQFIFWKYSMYCDGATVSQKMLEIEYKSVANNGVFSKKQRILYCLLMTGGEWLAGRAFDIKRYLGMLGNVEKLNSIIDIAVISHRFFSLLNFVAFLQNGRHTSLLERLLGIYIVFSKKQSPRQVYFEYMNDEILRKGFSEFLFCVLPLLNIPRLRNTLLRIMWKKENVQDHSVVQTHCGICGELPTNVHETNCGHLFCYICIKANSMADPSFLCPVCGEAVYDDIKPANR